MIAAVPNVRAMAPYALADLGDAAMTSLAQNESAFPASPTAIEAGQAALIDAPLYPDPDWGDLRSAIAAAYGVPRTGILCGAGSMELIGCLIRSFAGPGDQVLGTQYGYLFVASATAQAGAEYITVPEPDYTVSVDLILGAITPATRVVFVCNPGNPTGTTLPNIDLIRLREALSSDILLVVDQAYGEFDSQDPSAIFGLVERGDTVVTRTFSKAYGLAGARVGWGLFPQDVGGEMRKLLNPNNISGVAQAMAMAAVADQAHMRRTVDQTAVIREDLMTRLRPLGLQVPDSHTNFVLIPFASEGAAMAADRALRSEGLLLRGMGGYGLGHCLRATIGSAPVMARLADTLNHYLECEHG